MKPFRASLLVFLLISVVSAAQAADFAAWSKTMPITFSGYNPPGGGTVANFPVLVRLNDSLTGFSYASMSSPADGADLRFAAGNQLDELNYEIEKWDPAGTSFVWVQVPLISGTNTRIWAIWGNPDATAPAYATNGATWTNGYRTVWHMGQGGSSRPNSATNLYHGTVDASGVIATTAGVIGNADLFTGTETGAANAPPANGGITVSSSLPGTGSQTIEYWMNAAHMTQRQSIIHKAYGGELTMVLETNNSASSRAVTYAYGSVGTDGGSSGVSFFATRTPNNMISSNQWIHLTHVRQMVTASSATNTWYVNGLRVASLAKTSLTPAASTNIFAIGKGYVSCFNGMVDEVRISSVARASNWVWATWMNTASNAAFNTFGTEALTVQALTATPVGETNAMLRGRMVQNGGTSATDVYFCWDTSDKLTAATGDWAHVEHVGDSFVNGQSFSAVLSSLPAGSPVVYRCYATNATGEAWSAGAPAFTPSAMVVSAVAADRQVSLTWSNVTGTTGYQVGRSLVSGGPYTAVETGLTTNTYLHTGLTNGVTNYYVITASTPIGDVVSTQVVARPWVWVLVRAINCGGPAVGSFLADTNYTAGSTVSTTSNINLTAVTDPAPEAVYQSARSGATEYFLSNFHPDRRYKVRAHFAEIVYPSGNNRSFHLSYAVAAGTYTYFPGATWIDILTDWAGGGANKAVIRELTSVAPTTAAGQIKIKTEQTLPLINGIDIFASDGPLPNASVYPRDGYVGFNFTAAIDTHTFSIWRSDVSGGPYTLITNDLVATTTFTDTTVANGSTYYYKVTGTSNFGDTDSEEFAITPGILSFAINVNGTTLGRFAAENASYTRIGGTAGNIAIASTQRVARATIDPAEDLTLYRYYRTGPQTNIFPNLVPGADYLVRLHLSEPAKTSAGTRVFHVDANGVRKLENLDIFAEAGGRYLVLIKEFTATADVDGNLTVVLAAVTDQPILSGIEIRQQSGLMAPPPPTSVTAAGQPDFVILSWDMPAAGCTVLRSVTPGGPYTVLATNMVGNGYVDAAVLNGTGYYYRVATEYEGVEVESSRSAEVFAFAGFKTAVNAGGTATGRFSADSGFNTSSQLTNLVTIALGGVPHAAPEAVYQRIRYANDFTWSYTGESNHLYRVRLHFAECWTGGDTVGERVFHVKQDGATIFGNVDIFAEAGTNTALVKEFFTTVNSASKIAIQFVRAGSGSAAIVNGIEVIDCTAAANGLYAQYFADYTEAGAAERLARSEVASGINTNWSGTDIGGSPLVGDRNAKVVWNGTVMLTRNATYTFYAKAAGGFRLWVTNAIVVNKWNESLPGQYVSGTRSVGANGFYSLHAEFYNLAGNADVVLEWESKNAGIPRQVVPAVYLRPVSIGDPGAWVSRDVGANSLPGYSVASATVPGQIGLYAAGTEGIAVHQFACQKVTGPFELTARLANYYHEDRYNATWNYKVGLAVRGSLSANSGSAYGLVRGWDHMRVLYNDNLAVSGVFASSNVPMVSTPVYLRINRRKQGGSYYISTASSANGTTWTTNFIGTNASSEATVYAGMTLGVPESQLMYGYFDNITLVQPPASGSVILFR